MIFRLLKYAIKNTLRNKFLSISSVLVLTLLMFFINILGLLEGISGEVISTINSKMTISLYLKDDYSQKSIEIVDLRKDILKLNTNIKFEYKTKEVLLGEWKKNEPELVGILEKNNPLPNTIAIGNVEISDYEKLNDIIENKMFILESNDDKNYFANYTTQYKRIIQVTSILNLLKTGLHIVILIFFIAIAVISYSVISNFVYYYRDEIYITKLVGGANIFIYGPFVLQGIFYSILSFLLSLAFFIILSKNLVIIFGKYYDFEISGNILLLEFIIFVFIGAISGYFSSRKYLGKDGNHI